MTDHETAIAERLRDAAGRIPVDADVRAVTGRVRLPVARNRRHGRRGVIAGVAVAAGVAAVAIAVVAAPGTVDVETSPAVQPGADGAGDAADAAGSGGPDGASTDPADAYAAHLPSPPDWFGEPQAAYRPGTGRTGRAVAMAIGRVSADGGTITAPILIAVYDGSYLPPVGLEDVTIDGTPLRAARSGDWRALVARVGTTDVMVSGSVDQDTLLAVLDTVEVTDPSGEFSLRLPSRPDGYQVIARPWALWPDRDAHRTLASESGDVAIGEVSDLRDPLLHASGADLTAVDLDGTTGWTGVSTLDPGEPIRFLVWSPRPGVIFEVVTSAADRTTDDLVDLARGTSAVGADDWDGMYGRATGPDGWDDGPVDPGHAPTSEAAGPG